MFDCVSGRHTVVYDDGDQREELLNGEKLRWQFLTKGAAVNSSPPEGLEVAPDALEASRRSLLLKVERQPSPRVQQPQTPTQPPTPQPQPAMTPRRQCGTPDCTMDDCHEGLCDSDELPSKRRRCSPSPSTDVGQAEAPRAAEARARESLHVDVVVASGVAVEAAEAAGMDCEEVETEEEDEEELGEVLEAEEAAAEDVLAMGATRTDEIQEVGSAVGAASAMNGSNECDNWLQCDRCRKWRMVGAETARTMGGDRVWVCEMNPDPARASCSAPEDQEPSPPSPTALYTPSIQPPPAAPPLCLCGHNAVWARERWWCARRGPGRSCIYEAAPPPPRLPMTPPCACGLPAVWLRDHWWCAKGRAAGCGLAQPCRSQYSHSANPDPITFRMRMGHARRMEEEAAAKAAEEHGNGHSVDSAQCPVSFLHFPMHRPA